MMKFVELEVFSRCACAGTRGLFSGFGCQQRCVCVVTDGALAHLHSCCASVVN